MPSTVIRSHSYSAESGVMKVTFVSGITYEYFNVSLELYEKFTKAFAKGIFFNRFIKPKREFRRVE
ncbi:MAG: KTSC domain-containing protein [Chitinophagaceae bacterium]|nr:MAG: KTSC domain-containing protein [Chitinophagaceae bacterium]